MTTVQIFDVYLAEFPFIESSVNKIRPVIVVYAAHSKHNIVAIIPISSQPHLEKVDCVLKEWQNAGLLKPSVARIHRLTTMQQSSLVARLGTVVDSDKQLIRQSIATYLSLQC